MNRAEMIDAVRRLMSGEISESEMEELPLRLDRAAPGSRITDLIYHPEEDFTPEQIVDEALARVGTWNDS